MDKFLVLGRVWVDNLNSGGGGSVPKFIYNCNCQFIICKLNLLTRSVLTCICDKSAPGNCPVHAACVCRTHSHVPILFHQAAESSVP